MSIVVTTGAVVELLTTERAFLLDRLAEVCPDHQRCMECNGPLCEACRVGGTTSRCPHGDPICSACDPTDRCGDCYVEQRENDRAAREGRPRWVDPFAGPGRIIRSDDLPSVAAFIDSCIREVTR